MRIARMIAGSGLLAGRVLAPGDAEVAVVADLYRPGDFQTGGLPIQTNLIGASTQTLEAPCLQNLNTQRRLLSEREWVTLRP